MTVTKILLSVLVTLLVGSFSFAVDEVALFTTPNPNGHPEFVAAINHAQKSIRMEMYHLDDMKVVEALMAAKKRGVQISLILDGKSLSDPKFGGPAQKLKQAGVDVRPSSPFFSITHVKAFVVDSAVAYITSINLTMGFAFTRDYGIATRDPAIVKEMLTVFLADWNNATNSGGVTPPLHDPNLVWSPVNSELKLKTFIDSARQTIVSTVENLGDPAIMQALVQAAARGVNVRIIVPMCDLNSNPLFNYPFLYSMKNVNSRVMPAPSTPTHPYMHGKMILVDNNRAYVGSVNFSPNSTQRARELGILFQNPAIAQQLARIFEIDWQNSVPTPATPPTDCPKP